MNLPLEAELSLDCKSSFRSCSFSASSRFIRSENTIHDQALLVDRDKPLTTPLQYAVEILLDGVDLGADLDHGRMEFGYTVMAGCSFHAR